MGVLVDWFGGKQPEETEDTSAVLYSDLSFGETYRPKGLKLAVPVRISCLFPRKNCTRKNAGGVLGGHRHWDEGQGLRYDVASDKFEPGGVLHMQKPIYGIPGAD